MLSLFLIDIFHTHLNMNLVIVIKCYAQDNNLHCLRRVFTKVFITGIFGNHIKLLQENCTTHDNLFVFTLRRNSNSQGCNFKCI